MSKSDSALAALFDAARAAQVQRLRPIFALPCRRRDTHAERRDLFRRQRRERRLPARRLRGSGRDRRHGAGGRTSHRGNSRRRRRRRALHALRRLPAAHSRIRRRRDPDPRRRSRGGVRRTFRLSELLPNSSPGPEAPAGDDAGARPRPATASAEPGRSVRRIPRRAGARRVDGQPRRPHPPRRPDARLAKRWASKRWLNLPPATSRAGRRDVWGRFYTELFFLDEPTALAAGHGPCFNCRRAAAKAFQAAFPGAPDGADAIDEVLHRERLADGSKPLWRARLGALPDATMIVWGQPRACAARQDRPEPWVLPAMARRSRPVTPPRSRF